MVAALVRLLHSGTQDQRLMPKQPTDISAYKRVLVRAGRMTTQWARLDFQQKPVFGQTAYCTLQRKGELLTRLYLVSTMPDIGSAQAAAAAAAGLAFVGPRFVWTNSLGHALVEQLTLDVGGNRVETMDSRLLELLDEFNTPLEKVTLVNEMIKRVQNGYPSQGYGATPGAVQVIVPLPFWFCNGDLGSALPIDALNVDEVRAGITFRPLQGLVYTESRGNGDECDGTDQGDALWQVKGSKFYKDDPLGQIVPGLYPDPPSGFASVIQGVAMPQQFELGDTYLLAEYVYLDKAEANRFRGAAIEVPVVQHMRIDPVDTKGARVVGVPIEISNPVRHMYWMAQNYDATKYNAFFLATKDLTGPDWSPRQAPWWPDCSGLYVEHPGDLVPGFAMRGSEPFTYMELLYEGSYVRTSTENMALYRSILPSYEERKSPWHNRYMYALPFGVQNGYFGASTPMGEANFNRIMKKELRLGIQGYNGIYQRLWVHSWVETYNVLRIYGGRASMLFST